MILFAKALRAWETVTPFSVDIDLSGWTATLNKITVYHIYCFCKFEFTPLKLQFTLLKFEFTPLKLQFILLKFKFTPIKLQFTLLKFEFTLLKLQFTLLKFRLQFTLLKFEFSPLKLQFNGGVDLRTRVFSKIHINLEKNRTQSLSSGINRTLG